MDDFFAGAAFLRLKLLVKGRLYGLFLSLRLHLSLNYSIDYQYVPSNPNSV